MILVKAPKIPIPGQEWDNPNTPLDDRRLKTVPEEYARPVVPDFDHDSDPDETDVDDNDGVIEPYDPEPRNPYVPRASSEPPPLPDDDRTNQSEGERAVSDVRDTHGDFLEKAENDVFENRLDTIEAKYKRAAAMEDETLVDTNAGFEQQRLIDEAVMSCGNLEMKYSKLGGRVYHKPSSSYSGLLTQPMLMKHGAT